MEHNGRFTLPTRVYLTAEQRTKLDALLHQAEQNLDVLVTKLLEGYLDAQPMPPPEPEPANDELSSELAGRQRELRRLRTKLNDPYNPAPDWLLTMVADLEAEIARLEGK
ncbi:hypothetical protein [Candidatus Oscillochloris fontis]|uniref:hypothetical protein n=1 Tax=Candidatus Oscillochloris fontis TaxID=2496868 RepID=UPI00101BE5A8|nr:hypothetical protein [Candidatus Oscillochloris fontis]